MSENRLEPLEPRLLFTAVPLITEFLASSDAGLQDEDGDSSDWVELYNAGDSALDLNGWHLTDDAGDLTQWSFPSVSLNPGEYLVVFASNKDRADADGTELHTNFKLGAGGEYLALVESDGATVASEFAPEYPAQSTDVSYGISMSSTATTLVAEGSTARYRVPTGSIPGWNTLSFNDSGWTQGPTGIGYETFPADFAGLIETAVPTGTGSVYLRQSFNVTDPAAFDTLTLGLRYDDGFVAYLNGAKVAEMFAPAGPQWNSTAIGSAGHSDAQAAELEPFDLTGHLGELVAGSNVLAIQVMNSGAGSSDLLIEPVLTVGVTSIEPASLGFMVQPTPGAANVISGPLITSVTQDPPQPSTFHSIVVEIAVADNAGNGVARVDLHSRVNFGGEVASQAFDNGLGPDTEAGDGIYTTTISSGRYNPGDMVRWYATAQDTQGTVSRAPTFLDQSGNNQSAQYFGTVVLDPAITASVPVFQWFTQNESASHSRAGTRASVFYDGRFYDNIYVRQRGASNSAQSQKFDFNKGDKFYVNEEVGSVGEINLNGNGADPAYVRQALAFETHRLAGNPGSISFLAGMWVNGGFDRVGVMIEQVDSDYLDRNGLDTEGSLYKVTSSPIPGLGHGGSGVEEKEDTPDLSEIITLSADLQALRQLSPTDSGRTDYIFDNFNVPEVVNYLAVRAITEQSDDMLKNFYLHRDSDTGEWSILPWDMDWSLGAVDYHLVPPPGQSSAQHTHPFYTTSSHPTDTGTGSQWNLLYDVMLDTPAIQDMMLRRLRSLMDVHLQTPDTPVAQRFLDGRADAMFAQAQSLLSPSVAGAITSLKNHIESRRDDLYLGHTVGGYHSAGYEAGIPDAQPAAPSLTIGDLDFAPVSGENDEEYIQLTNNNAFALDISGWTVEGAITHTFKPGTVIAAGQSLYLTPSSSTFRARTAGPAGGQGLFVQQWDGGHLSSFGETITINRLDGTIAAQLTYNGTNPGDITGDGYVGVEDLDQFLAYWGDSAESSPEADAADLDNSGTVGSGDLSIVLDNWGNGTLAAQPTSIGNRPDAPDHDAGTSGGDTTTSSGGGTDIDGSNGDVGDSTAESSDNNASDATGAPERSTQPPLSRHASEPERPIQPEPPARAVPPVAQGSAPVSPSRPAQPLSPTSTKPTRPQADTTPLTPDTRRPAARHMRVDVFTLTRMDKSNPISPILVSDNDTPRRRFNALAFRN